jgi:heme/copper-type cytochrome/quinol oxidase subunit 3
MSYADGLSGARVPAVPNVILGTLIFVVVEVMFFAALMSGYVVIQAGAGLRWIPPPNVRLPVEATAFNTLALLVSGVLMVLAMIWFAKAQGKARWAFFGAMVLGTTFVVLQGREWVQLLALGMTLTSGVYGASFYLLIGAHGLHAVSAILAMLFLWAMIAQGTARSAHIHAMGIYWLFIVGVWPVLYRLVYF